MHGGLSDFQTGIDLKGSLTRTKKVGSEMGKLLLLPSKIEETSQTGPISDSALVVTLTVGQLRELVREEIRAAMGSPGHGEDRLLTAEQASELLSLSSDWLYRHAKKLPFTRKLGPKMLRFSEAGIKKWLETRRVTH
jgi:excisionase family DNA binding protein